jgi:FkbM family methyltransferase
VPAGKDHKIGFRWITLLLGIPVRVRLPFGAVWLAENDACGRAVLRNRFENAERQFVERFLQPGMTVLDIGAHHGYYTLLASHRVGENGKVFAFEPSPRERGKLGRHLRLNGCSNVKVEGFALGEANGPAKLFVVEGKETGCNSLRPPRVSQPTKEVEILVMTLDSYLDENQIGNVDFIKLDVEGAELSVLRGAAELIARRPRPVILCEVQDARSQSWGYPAKEIIVFLSRLDFRWFEPFPGGGLKSLSEEQSAFHGNYVAVPEERREALLVASREG